MLDPAAASLRAMSVASRLRHPAFAESLAPFVEAQYFESRLGAGADQVDHLVAFPRRAAVAVQRLLAESLSRHAAATQPRWAAIARAFETWGDGRSGFSKHVPTVWLEYDDVHAEHASDAVPSICVCMVPSYRSDRALIRSDGRRERQIIGEVLELLLLQPTAGQARALGVCLDEPAIRWIHLSAMVGREAPTLKLFGLLRRGELCATLRRLEFGGDEVGLMSFVNEHYPHDRLGEQVLIDVDLSTLTEGRLATLGLAVGQQHVADQDAEALQTTLLERWSQAGLCDPAKVQELRDWMALRRSATPNSFGRRCFLDYKLVWRSLADPIVKAYRGLYGGAPAALTD